MEYVIDENAMQLISADEARRLSARKEEKKDTNFTLTLYRVMRLVRIASKNGQTFLEFEAPSFVLDGSLADPIVLARQLKARFKELGYKVKRNECRLKIDWS